MWRKEQSFRACITRVAVFITSLSLFAAASTAADVQEEIIVTSQFPVVEARLVKSGRVTVRQRRDVRHGVSFDDVSFVQLTNSIPANATSPFGVEVTINTRPTRAIQVAEVWSGPEANAPSADTANVWVHTVLPPDTVVFYCPPDECLRATVGDWTLALYSLGPVEQGDRVASNVSLDDDRSSERHNDAQPFFKHTFHLYEP